MSTLTDEERESLSPSEIEAIENADADEELIGTDETPAGNDDELDVDALKAIAGADDAPATPEATAETTADEPGEFTPRYVAEPVADAAAQFAALEEKKDTLRTQLSEGDIGLDEFTAQYDAIGKEERALERSTLKAEIASEQSQQSAEQRWAWEQEQFFADKANVAYKDKYLLAALNEAVKDLANDPANGTKAGPWFLNKANEMIRERFGAPATPKVDPPTPPVVNGKPRVQPPPTLANMPSAELPETGMADEFAHLDKLTGFHLEAALARMTQEQQDRYLGAS